MNASVRFGWAGLAATVVGVFLALVLGFAAFFGAAGTAAAAGAAAGTTAAVPTEAGSMMLTMVRW